MKIGFGWIDGIMFDIEIFIEKTYKTVYSIRIYSKDDVLFEKNKVRRNK